MPKKHGFLHGLFGWMFDMDGDGEEDLGKQWLGFQIMDDIMSEDGADKDAEDFGAAAFDIPYASPVEPWRLTCEDGLEYGVDLDDYETEEEYQDALKEAKDSWASAFGTGGRSSDPNVNDAEPRTQNHGEDNMKFESNNSPETAETNAEKNRTAAGYPNKRREKAAQHLNAGFRIYFDKEELQLEDERCRFILKYADSVLAANYLTHTGHFLYAQAVKDHFWLPCSLPDEDEERGYKFFEVVRKIARYDIPLSLEIWRWCLSRFLPFAKYAVFAELEMSGHVLESLYGFPDGFLNALVHSIDTDHVFREQITRKCTEPHNAFPDLVAVAVKENLEETALFVFRRALEQAGAGLGKNQPARAVYNYQVRAGSGYRTCRAFPRKTLPFGQGDP